jgi:hypothetical protein
MSRDASPRPEGRGILDRLDAPAFRLGCGQPGAQEVLS